jgi:hypothetical protein
MPKGGSRKGEHRGNARKKEGRSNQIMRVAVRRADKTRPGKFGSAPKRPKASSVDLELMAARIADGPPRRAADMTPKEIMLDNMHFFQQAAYDFEVMAMYAARGEISEETSRQIAFAEEQGKQNRLIAHGCARDVAQYLHPRLAAVKIVDDPGAGVDIVQRMLDEVDERNRNHPMVIEHISEKKTA